MADQGFKETAADPILNYRFRLLKANIIACGDPDAALALLSGVPPPSSAQAELEAEREYVQAFAEGCAGNYQRADRLLDAAEKLAAQNKPELLPYIANLGGWVAGNENDHAREEAGYQKALDLLAKYPSPISGGVQANIGLIHLREKHYRSANEMFLAALESARKWRDRQVEEVALGNLGSLHEGLGDWTVAEEYSKPASEIAGEIGRLDDQEAWLISLGREYQADARQLHDEADDAYQRAVAIATKRNHTDAAAKCFNNLAQLSLKRREVRKAEEYARRAEEQHPKGDTLLYLKLNQAEIATEKQRLSDAKALFQEAISSRPAPPPLLLWRFKTDLAKIFAQEKSYGQADSWFEKASQTAEKAYAEMPEDEQRITFGDSAPFYSAYVSYLVDRNKPAEALAVAELGRARSLAEVRGIRTRQREAANVRKVQASLKEGKEVVLAYFLTDEKSFLWAITHSQIKVFQLPPLKDLYQNIQSYDKQIHAQQKRGDSQTGEQLYRQLVRPAERLIPKNALVTVIPNRILYHLSFDALVVPGAESHYWVEDVSLQICGALSLLADFHHAQAAPSRRISILGAAVQAPNGPPPLESAPAEMKSVQKHFSASQVISISGKEATPQSYLSGHPEQFRFIHFAAHGLSNPTRPLESAIVLSPGLDGTAFLAALQIIKIKIRADLVTISSCRSAGERTYDTEGLVGLGWAFLHAGAHQVVAGLWDVDDGSSPQLMDDFYAGIASGENAASALRAAKVKMLRSGGTHALPEKWAPLQVYVGR